MRAAQLALDGALAENQRKLIRSEQRLWENGHLNDEPPARSTDKPRTSPASPAYENGSGRTDRIFRVKLGEGVINQCFEQT